MNNKKNVRFEDSIRAIEEPIELAEDLHIARISDWVERQLNKMRMEKLLTPILKSTHRNKILLQLNIHECCVKLSKLNIM